MNEIVINYHINSQCNFHCIHCFSKWEKKERFNELHLNIKHLEIMLSDVYNFFKTNSHQQLNIGYRNDKIRLNIVGGEPLLLKNFGDIVSIANKIGYNVGIVTNGSLIDEAFIRSYSQYLSIIGLSIDATDKTIMRQVGRSTKNGNVVNLKKLISHINMARKINSEIKIKVNTVVNQSNVNHHIDNFIQKISPDKWKIIKVLPLFTFTNAITDEQFEIFINNHQQYKSIMSVEKNYDMIASYIMIDPFGRFFDNSMWERSNQYIYSAPIMDTGAANAFRQIQFDVQKFDQRY